MIATEVQPAVKFSREIYSQELMDEMLPLWEKHYEEIALYKDIALNPDLKIYEQAERLNMLRIFTIREGKSIVGYEFFFIHPHPHYSVLEAMQDILYLKPSLRHGWIGYNFMKWCDEQLEIDSMKVIFRCVSNMNNYSSLLERLGYVPHDVVFSRRFR